MKAFQRNATLFTVSLFPLPSINAIALQAKQYSDFGRYVLAPSWQTGFYQNQCDRNRNERDECRPQAETTNKADFLTVRGLWPGLLRSVAACGVDERRWICFGCATYPILNLSEARASRTRSSPETGLSLEMVARLGEVTPGAGGRSYLECCEHAKHDACFGLDPNACFGVMARLSQGIKESEAGRLLTDSYGKTVSRRDFNTAFAKSWGKENAKAVKLVYQGNPVYLTETQISVKVDTINIPPSVSSFSPQPHPGNCGKTFVIDKAGC